MVFQAETYKQALKQAFLDQRASGLSLKKLADRLSLQYTYLSKILNAEKGHLSDEQIWLIGNELKLHESEIDFISLLKAYELSQNEQRRALLERKIQAFRQTKSLKAKTVEFDSDRQDLEQSYFLNPYCVLIYVSLHCPEFRSNLQKLRFQIGLSEAAFSESLDILSRLGFVRMNNTRKQVLDVAPAHTHYSVDHPFVRIHQNLLRALAGPKMQSLKESSKKSFMVTFASDEKAFEEIKQNFQNFIQSVEKITLKSKARHTYQLNFDFFQWW